MLMIIATNAMLTTEKFPRKNEDWEELDYGDHTWTNWKKLYRTAAKKTAIKAKPTEGKDLLGAANKSTKEDMDYV